MFTDFLRNQCIGKQQTKTGEATVSERRSARPEQSARADKSFARTEIYKSVTCRTYVFSMYACPAGIEGIRSRPGLHRTTRIAGAVSKKYKTVILLDRMTACYGRKSILM
jgi:hypothetical protein